MDARRRLAGGSSRLVGSSRFPSPLLVTQQRGLNGRPMEKDPSAYHDVGDLAFGSPVVQRSSADRDLLQNDLFVAKTRDVTDYTWFFFGTHRCAPTLSITQGSLAKGETALSSNEIRILISEIRLSPSEFGEKPSEWQCERA
jgi:hypothetical protein